MNTIGWEVFQKITGFRYRARIGRVLCILIQSLFGGCARKLQRESGWRQMRHPCLHSSTRFPCGRIFALSRSRSSAHGRQIGPSHCSSNSRASGVPALQACCRPASIARARCSRHCEQAQRGSRSAPSRRPEMTRVYSRAVHSGIQNTALLAHWWRPDCPARPVSSE